MEPATPVDPTALTDPAAQTDSTSGERRALRLWIALLLLALLIYPLVVPSFFAFQIGGQILILGMIGLSLMVLAGLGGMVSLAQLTVAGVAGYMVAIFGTNSVGVMGFGWPWWLAVPVAILIAACSSASSGSRTTSRDGPMPRVRRRSATTMPARSCRSGTISRLSAGQDAAEPLRGDGIVPECVNWRQIPAIACPLA